MAGSEGETTLGRLDRLRREVVEIIPTYTTARGSFNSMPPRYKARNPEEWQQEFWETLQIAQQRGFEPDTSEIYGLVAVVNDIGNGARVAYPVSIGTLSSVVGYVVFEMLIRRLTPAIDAWGCLVQPVPGLRLNERVSGLKNILSAFEQSTLFTDLKSDLQHLNSMMSSQEMGRTGQPEDLDLYGRLNKGRNLMLHGNLTHSFEGHLLVLLVDLVVLHVVRQELLEQVQAS